ncbi:MAG TPA: GNAT family N-acetyltransferase [Burkholderiaceae bacterium]|nr:GNAT family N-acetyltransferase [Burkholderiaceae bacterium]
MAIGVVPIDLAVPWHAAALRDLLAAYAADPAGGGQALAPDVLERLPRLLAGQPNYVGFIAFDSADPIGLVNCFIAVSTFKAAPLLNVHDIVVRSSHRGRGVGAALLAAVEREARARGCCKITLEVLEGNGAALALYRRVGFDDYRLDPQMGRALFMQKWL